MNLYNEIITTLIERIKNKNTEINNLKKKIEDIYNLNYNNIIQAKQKELKKEQEQISRIQKKLTDRIHKRNNDSLNLFIVGTLAMSVTGAAFTTFFSLPFPIFNPVISTVGTFYLNMVITSLLFIPELISIIKLNNKDRKNIAQLEIKKNNLDRKSYIDNDQLERERLKETEKLTKKIKKKLHTKEEELSKLQKRLRLTIFTRNKISKAYNISPDSIELNNLILCHTIPDPRYPINPQKRKLTKSKKIKI